MFAVIKTGGKQYRVSAGDVIKIEKILGDAGSPVRFDNVLMVGGESVILDATELASISANGIIIEQARNKKVIIFKKRRRQNSRRKNGHRQHVTFVKITDITVAGADKKASVAPKTVKKTETKE